MMLNAFTVFHVALSLVGIGSGFVVAIGMLSSKRLDRWTAVFLATTVLTSVTGFMFPFHGFLPSYGVGIVSLLILAAAIFARYRRHLAGPWRRTYVITAVIALYFNFFVLIAQLFMKVPALKAMAPTQTELPFKVAQLVALIFFVLLGTLAASRFKAEPERVGQVSTARAA
jgi:hypothetical protein